MHIFFLTYLNNNDGNNEAAVHEPLNDDKEAGFHEPLGGEAAVCKPPDLSDDGDAAVSEPLNEEDKASGKPLQEVAVGQLCPSDSPFPLMATKFKFDKGVATRKSSPRKADGHGGEGGRGHSCDGVGCGARRW